MRVFTLQREQLLPSPLDAVFRFFADPANLDHLTPRSLRFQILTPRPIAMRAGATIEYRIRWRGLPLRWHTTIAEYEPPRRFVDEQTSGPYALWRHEHIFESAATPAGGPATRVIDRVQYALRRWAGGGGVLGRLVERCIVCPDLVRIFDYRRRALVSRFGSAQTPPERH